MALAAGVDDERAFARVDDARKGGVMLVNVHVAFGIDNHGASH